MYVTYMYMYVALDYVLYALVIYDVHACMYMCELLIDNVMMRILLTFH